MTAGDLSATNLLFTTSVVIVLIYTSVPRCSARSVNQIIVAVENNVTCYDRKENFQLENGMITDSFKYCEAVVCSGVSVSYTAVLTSRFSCQDIFQLLPIDTICSINIGFRFPHCCSQCADYRRIKKLADETEDNHGMMTLNDLLVVISNSLKND